MGFPEISRTVTADMVRLYGQVNGDRNLLHYDTEAARAAGYPDCVAHGAITAAIMQQACLEYFGPGWFSGGRLRITFTAPVLVGDTIVTGGRTLPDATERQGVHRRVEVFCARQDGAIVMAGEAEA